MIREVVLETVAVITSDRVNRRIYIYILLLVLRHLLPLLFAAATNDTNTANSNNNGKNNYNDDGD